MQRLTPIVPGISWAEGMTKHGTVAIPLTRVQHGLSTCEVLNLNHITQQLMPSLQLLGEWICALMDTEFRGL